MCQYLFKLSYPFGVVRAQRDYVVANTVHDIMSLAFPTVILDNWEYRVKDYENRARLIERDAASIIEEVLKDKRDWIRRENRPEPENYEDDLRDRFHGLLVGFSKRIMSKYWQPKRALTEITITNTGDFQEGRPDGIAEYSGNYFALVDWKAYDLDKASQHEMWQLLSNILLANYRYTGSEDNWSKCLFGCVAYYGGAYVPRIPLNPARIQKLKNDRMFAHEVLCGRSPKVQKPAFCPVCNTGAEGCSDCRFYREDSLLAYEGRLPDNYNQIRKLLLNKRYRILEQRAETHRHKFIINTLIDRLGEDLALQELEKTGIVHRGYQFISYANSSFNNSLECKKLVTLRKNDFRIFLEPRKVIRIIGKENGIPLLSCVNIQGVIKEVNGPELVVDLHDMTSARRATQQVFSYPLILMPDEINLTRRILEPLHKFHRLAAEIMLPIGYYNNENSA
jgi:hypothetical protein